jgi:cobalamin synthase
VATPLEPEGSVDEPPDEATAVVSDRASVTRQRPLAAIVVAAAILVVIGLTAGPWARTTFSGGGGDAGDSDGEASELDVELDPSGSVHVGEGDAELTRRYESSDNQLQRAVLEASVPGSSRELALVLVVLVALIAAVALLRDLTPNSWVLVAALAVACLVMVVMLRDEVISALATTTSTMDVGEHETHPTFWGALAVGASAAAALAAAFAAAPRPTRGPAATEGAATRPGFEGRRRIGWPTRPRRNRF